MRIAFLGTYVPRRCGIGTFTADLCAAVLRLPQHPSCCVVAINDKQPGYSYPDEVRFEINQDDLASYRRAADLLNAEGVDILSLQHEYGIFGGEEGQYVLEFLDVIRAPVVSTLHTILREPTSLRRLILQRIAERSDRVVVMSSLGRQLLYENYAVQPGRIELIPHGIPDAPFRDSNLFKDQFGLAGRFVLLTFGLLGPNKGLEQVIEALPAIVARHPEAVYLIVGETAKFWLDREGESYRTRLMELARNTGVENHVVFHKKFVPLHELLEYLGAADVYITPYTGEEQIASGTLSYALGLGKAVISTPYYYARELLDSGRGILVPFGDANAIAGQVIDLIQNEPRRRSLCRQAYSFGRHMIWPVVGESYFRVFEQAKKNHGRPVS